MKAIHLLGNKPNKRSNEFSLMKYDLVIKEEAIVDMQQAYDYYEERKTGLGERFLNTLEEYLGRVRKNPLH